MKSRILLALLLLPALASAQVEIISPTQVREAIINPDGSTTYRTQTYWNEQFYRNGGGSWQPIQLDWTAMGGKWGVTNGTYQISLDSATQILRIQRGNHILKSRLAGIGYYDPTRDSVRILDSYSPGPVVRSGRKASRNNYFTGVDVQWRLSRAGLKEYWKISQAARAAFPTPGSLGLSNAQSRLIFATQLWVDSLNLTAKAAEGVVDFVNALTTSGPIEFKNAKDSLIFSIVESYAWVPDLGGDTSKTSAIVTLASRFERRNGNVYLIQGARAADLNALPAGPIVFDPPHNFTLANDEWMRSAGANQHDDQRTNATWQVGWLTAPTFTAMQDTLYATGDHTPEMWARSTGSDSWALVDETTPNTTDYISTANQYDTTVLTFQDLAPSLDATFHVFDSMLVKVHLRQFGGDNGYIALIADTSGDGVNNFYQFDSVLTTSSFATTTKKLFAERSITAADSLKIGVVTKWDPSTTAYVSWLVAVPYWKKTATDGDALHQWVQMPNAMFRGTSWTSNIPISPDSGFIMGYFDPSYSKDDANFHIRVYGVVMGKDPDIPGQMDWVHRTHSSRSWKAKGAKWTTQFLDETASAADVYCQFFVDSLDTTTDTGWVAIRVPDTVLYAQWFTDLTGISPANGVMIEPDPRETGTSRRQAHSLDGVNDPYVTLFCTVRPPRMQVGGFSTGDTIPGFGRYDIGVTLTPDSADHGMYDSALVLYKYVPDTAWAPLWVYTGPMMPFGAYLDTSYTNRAIDTVGKTKANVTLWDFGPNVTVVGQGLFPNREGACSLMVAAYTSKGNGDTQLVRVYIDSSFWMMTLATNAVHVDSNAPTFNFGAAPEVRVGKQRNVLFRANNLPTPVTMAYTKNINVRRILRLTKKGAGSVSPMTFQAMRMDSTAWVAGALDSAAASSGEVTWNAYKAGTSNWATAGGDFDADSIHDTTIMSFIGANEQYGYLDVTDLVRADSINGGLRYLAGPREIADFYPVSEDVDTLRPSVLTVWNVQQGPASGDAAFWCKTGTQEFARTTSNGARVAATPVTSCPFRPKIVLLFVSLSPSTAPTTWSNLTHAYFGVAATCERVGGDGLLCIGYAALDNQAGSDGASWGGMGYMANFATPGNGQFYHAEDGFGTMVDAWLTGYTATGFTYDVDFDVMDNADFLQVSWIAWGGNDITNIDAMVRSISRTTSAFTNAAYNTNPPTFQPDLLITLWNNAAERSTFVQATHAASGCKGVTLGFADNTNDVLYSGANFGGENPILTRGISNREWDYYEFTSVDAEAEEAVRVRWVGFTATGFTFSAARDTLVATGANNASFMYIAVKGGDWDVEKADGKNISAGTSQAIPTPDLAQTPIGALFMSAGMPDTVKEFQDNAGAIDGAADTMWVGAQTCWGAWDGTAQFALLPSVGWTTSGNTVPRIDLWHTTNRACVTYHQRPASAPSGVDEAISGASLSAGNVNITWNTQRGGALVASDIGILAFASSSTATAKKYRRRRSTPLIGMENEKDTAAAVFVWPSGDASSSGSDTQH